MIINLSSLDPAVRAMLLEDIPVQTGDVHAALAVGDFERARNAVHSIRGSAAFCRLETLQEAAAALETAILEERIENDLKKTFMQEVEAVLIALRTDINTNSG